MMSWLRRLFGAAAKGAVRITPLPKADDYRALLFPDERAEGDPSAYRPFFNQFNFRVHVAGDRDRAELRDTILRGDVDAARRLAAPLRHRAPDVGFLLDVTSGIHELRHFHDLFGTTWGFEQISAVIEDGMAFAELLDAQRAGRTLKLPLARWGTHADAPQPLVDYLRNRRASVEWFDVVDGTMPAPRLPGHASSPTDAVILVHFKGVQAHLPAYAMNMVHQATGTPFQLVVPLGARPLMEGNAVVVQRTIIRELFGDDAAEAFWQNLRVTTVDQGAVYTVVDSYIGSVLGPFNTEMQTVLADLALMSASHGETNDLPGFRLWRAVHRAKARGGYNQLVDHPAWGEYLSKECEWPTPSEVIADVRRRLAERLAEIPADGGAWNKVARAVIRTHDRMMQAREATAHILSSPLLYLAVSPHLPPPAVRQVGSTLEVKGLDQDAAEGFSHWYMLESLQGQLLFSTSISCPFAALGIHSCASWPDALTPGVADHCDFWAMARALRLGDFQVSSL